jgi:hypothetical protein
MLLIDGALFACLVLEVTYFWQWTNTSTAIAAAIVLIGFVFFHQREDIVFFITAAALGSLAEITVMQTGVWQYGNPVIFGLALWAPLFWGFAFLFGRRVRDAVFQLTYQQVHYARHVREPRVLLAVLLDIFLYGAIVLGALLLWQTSFTLLGVYIALLALALSVFHTRADAFFVILAVLVGTALEVVATRAGVWTHSNSALWGMPVWLPVAYGLFALIVRRAAVVLNHTLFRRSA